MICNQNHKELAIVLDKFKILLLNVVGFTFYNTLQLMLLLR